MSIGYLIDAFIITHPTFYWNSVVFNHAFSPLFLLDFLFFLWIVFYLFDHHMHNRIIGFICLGFIAISPVECVACYAWTTHVVLNFLTVRSVKEGFQTSASELPLLWVIRNAHNYALWDADLILVYVEIAILAPVWSPGVFNDPVEFVCISFVLAPADNLNGVPP